MIKIKYQVGTYLQNQVNKLYLKLNLSKESKQKYPFNITKDELFINLKNFSKCSEGHYYDGSSKQCQILYKEVNPFLMITKDP